MRWQQSHTRAMIVASLSTIAVAGCGDDEKKSQDDAVRKTVGSWYSAVARGDGAKACALMTEAGRKRDLTAGGAIVVEPSGNVRTAPATCEAQVQATGRELARTGLASEVNAAIVRDVRVLDDRATVSAEFAQRRQALVLRRVAGRWLVDGAPR
jgi:ketosteroid isomerase-like protein